MPAVRLKNIASLLGLAVAAGGAFVGYLNLSSLAKSEDDFPIRLPAAAQTELSARLSADRKVLRVGDVLGLNLILKNTSSHPVRIHNPREDAWAECPRKNIEFAFQNFLLGWRIQRLNHVGGFASWGPENELTRTTVLAPGESRSFAIPLPTRAEPAALIPGGKKEGIPPHSFRQVAGGYWEHELPPGLYGIRFRYAFPGTDLCGYYDPMDKKYGPYWRGVVLSDRASFLLLP